MLSYWRDKFLCLHCVKKTIKRKKFKHQVTISVHGRDRSSAAIGVFSFCLELSMRKQTGCQTKFDESKVTCGHSVKINKVRLLQPTCRPKVVWRSIGHSSGLIHTWVINFTRDNRIGMAASFIGQADVVSNSPRFERNSDNFSDKSDSRFHNSSGVTRMLRYSSSI